MLKLKEIRKSAKMSQVELAKKLGITQATLSGWENEKFEIDNNSLIKCSEIFEVTLDELLGRSSHCSICGFSFVPTIKDDVDAHKKNHEGFMRANQYFGKIWNSDMWETKKTEAYNIINAEKEDTDKRYYACVDLIKSYFSRSLSGCGYSLDHVDFKTYSSMLLNQQNFKDRFGVSYNRLCKEFGVRDGLEEGKTYYTPQDTPLPEGAIPVDLSTFIKIPVYGEVSAGLGCLAEDDIIGYDLVSPGSINKYEDYFFLKVKGDSMEPQICESDLALIQKCTSVDSGSVAVVIIDDENGVIKKVNYGDDWIELVSFNPYYPPRRFEGPDVQRIRVVGLVKEIKRKFN